MDTDKIKIFGSRVRVDSMQKASTWARMHGHGHVYVCMLKHDRSVAEYTYAYTHTT